MNIRQFRENCHEEILRILAQYAQQSGMYILVTSRPLLVMSAQSLTSIELYPMTWVELANADPCPCLALVFRGAGSTRPAICCWSQCAAPVSPIVFSSVFSTCHPPGTLEPFLLLCSQQQNAVGFESIERGGDITTTLTLSASFFPIVFPIVSLSCLPLFSSIVSPLEPWNILEPCLPPCFSLCFPACLPLCLPAVSQLSPDHIPIVSLLFPKCISGASHSSHVGFTLVFQLYPIVFLLSPHCLPVISPPFPTSIPLVSACLRLSTP